MGHERSKTVTRTFPKLGKRFVNVSESGKTLGPRKGFNNVKDAVQAAKTRSKNYSPSRKQPTTR